MLKYVLMFIFVSSISVIMCKQITKPDFNRFEDYSLNSIRYQNELSKEYHLRNGKDFVAQQLKKKNNLNANIARNTILFLGDGMSMPTIAASRVYAKGIETPLSFETFPFVAMAKTYCVDQQIADSACSATAYLCGVKGNFGTIGVNAKIKFDECTASEKSSQNYANSIALAALKAGKSIGLVTTTRVTHASPAGVYAHVANRNWECNVDVLNSKCNDQIVDDIAEQLVLGPIGSKMKVIFGGGRKKFIGQNEKDDQGFYGQRTDGKNLINDWLNNKNDSNLSETRTYVWNKNDLLSLKPKLNESVLGLFAASHCPYNYQVNGISDTIPTLSEMTMKAIQILDTNPNGFFLMLESGLIDYGLHASKAHIALDETVEFAKSIQLASDMLSINDTLFVVTADHSHTLQFNGYPDRGTSIFGVSDRSDVDFKPYLKLSFANGPGYVTNKNLSSIERYDPTVFQLHSIDFEQPATFPADDESHGGDDVAVYAAGPNAHLFTGSIEQNVIPHYMAYASCIGEGITFCNKANKTNHSYSRF